MAVALPGAWVFFRHIQESLIHVESKRLDLTRSVHKILADFQWLADDLSKRPTRLYYLVPLQPMLGNYHNTSGYMCVDSVLLGPTAVPWTP